MCAALRPSLSPGGGLQCRLKLPTDATCQAHSPKLIMDSTSPRSRDYGKGTAICTWLEYELSKPSEPTAVVA